jgi:cardiolipin synthase
MRTGPWQKTFARYWDFSIPSAEVKPTQISKVRFHLCFFIGNPKLTNSVKFSTILLYNCYSCFPPQSAPSSRTISPLPSLHSSQSFILYAQARSLIQRLYRWVVATTTIWSGASYIFTKGAVRVVANRNGVKPPNPGQQS